MAFSSLLASYGGGHALIISKVARSLASLGHEPTLLGLTTARKIFCDSGFEPLALDDLVEDSTRQYYDVIREFTAKEKHPDVTREETLAYFAIGFEDLVSKNGISEALSILRGRGRFAFEPVKFMERFLERNSFDIIITTTSPRFELALLKAARNVGVPSLAIADMFLSDEIHYVTGEEYADKVAVFCQEAGAELIEHGLDPEKVVVTGNPAFDYLAGISLSDVDKSKLKALLGLPPTKKIVLIPLAPVSHSLEGLPFINIEMAVDLVERFQSQNPEYFFVVRAHPNVGLHTSSEHEWGILDGGASFTLENLLACCDQVLVENSTVGLEASLLGLDVICFGGFDKQVRYPLYGGARVAEDLEEALKLSLTSMPSRQVCRLNSPPLGKAADTVAKTAMDLHFKKLGLHDI